MNYGQLPTGHEHPRLGGFQFSAMYAEITYEKRGVRVVELAWVTVETINHKTVNRFFRELCLNEDSLPSLAREFEIPTQEKTWWPLVKICKHTMDGHQSPFSNAAFYPGISIAKEARDGEG